MFAVAITQTLLPQLKRRRTYMIFANSINLGFGICRGKPFIHRLVKQAKDDSFRVPLGNLQQRRVPSLLHR